MIKKLLAAAVLSSTLLLSACGNIPQPSATTIDSDVQAVQAWATKICGFVPLAETVINIVGAGGSVAQSAQSVANSICAAVTSKAAKRGARPTVNGVKVRGYFVSKR